jgi:hypothetical protein
MDRRVHFINLGLRLASPGRNLLRSRPAKPDAALSAVTGRLEQEPGALFGLLGPVVYNARGGIVVSRLSNGLQFMLGADQREVIIAQLGQHRLRLDPFIVVRNRLAPRNIANRARRCYG